MDEENSGTSIVVIVVVVILIMIAAAVGVGIYYYRDTLWPPTSQEPVPVPEPEQTRIEPAPIPAPIIAFSDLTPAPIQTPPIQTPPIQTQPIQTQPIQTQPIQTQPIQTQPIQTQPIQTQPVKTTVASQKPKKNKRSKHMTAVPHSMGAPVQTPLTAPADSLPIQPIGTLPASGVPPSGSYVVNTLKDFGFIDEPDVFPKGAAPNIKNITQIAPGVFNFYLRHRGDPWSSLNPHGTKGAWYDGDSTGDWNTGKRDGRYHDKSRAECSSWVGKPKGFPEIVVGGTYDIASTVRLDPKFMPSNSYTMIMQPIFDLLYLSVSGDPTKSNSVSGELAMFGSGGTSGSSKTVATFDIPRGQWTSLVIRLNVGKTGSIKISVNGGSFKGLDHVDTTNRRSGHPMSCKWGLYGAATTGANRKPLPDQQVQHANVYVHKL